MKTRFIRIYWKTWKALRKEVPGRRGESCAEYLDRAIEELKLLRWRERQGDEYTHITERGFNKE